MSVSAHFYPKIYRQSDAVKRIIMSAECSLTRSKGTRVGEERMPAISFATQVNSLHSAAAPAAKSAHFENDRSCCIGIGKSWRSGVKCTPTAVSAIGTAPIHGRPRSYSSSSANSSSTLTQSTAKVHSKPNVCYSSGINADEKDRKSLALSKKKGSGELNLHEEEAKVERRLLPNGQFGVFARENIKPGEIILALGVSEISSKPSRYTVQVSEKCHVSGADLGVAKYLNHACDPNSHFLIAPKVASVQYEISNLLDFPGNPSSALDPKVVSNLPGHALQCFLIAVKPIHADEQVSFNYLTTEYDMDEKFTCNCKSTNCFSNISGFKHLNSVQRISIGRYLAPHLKVLL